MYQALVYILEETRMGVGVGKILEGGNFYPKKFQFWYLLPPISANFDYFYPWKYTHFGKYYSPIVPGVSKKTSVREVISFSLTGFLGTPCRNFQFVKLISEFQKNKFQAERKYKQQ